MTPVGRESSALSVRLPSLRPRLRLFGAAVAMSLGFVGCASPDVYQARDLPAHMHAPHIENAKTLELSRLAPVGYNEDMIDIDDVLEVHIQVSLNPQNNPPVMQPVVNKAGNISIVSVGEVHVQGLELQAAGSAIAAACIERGIYRAPQVTVLMSKKATNTVMVVGAVETEGPCKLPRGSSNLFTALVYAGMLADNAGTQVEVRNPPGPNSSLPDRIAGGPGAADIAQAGHSQSLPTSAKSSASSFRVDLVSATKPGATGSYQLQDGAIVMVERRDPEPIYVSGLVTKSGPIEYPLGTGINLLSAIAEAGGPSNRGANKVYIIRKVAGQPQPVMIEASIRGAKRNVAENLMLSPGDQLSVEQTPATVFIDTVNLIRFAIGTSLNPLL
jgi:polysaccharide export outer membrane protein